MKSIGMARGWVGVFFVSLALSGCGYSLSPTPYSLIESISVSVPLVTNQSRFGDLGPQLTTNVISRLDASTNISVREYAAATLKINISKVNVTGGSWRPDLDDDDLPINSASRIINISVEAIFERPNSQGGQPLTRRHTFSSQRTFLVSSNQVQVEFRQKEAFDWVIADLGQKITQTMFSEF